MLHGLLDKTGHILLLYGDLGCLYHKVQKHPINGMGGSQISVELGRIINFKDFLQIPCKSAGGFLMENRLPHFFIFFRIVLRKGTLKMKDSDLPILCCLIIVRLPAVDQNTVANMKLGCLSAVFHAPCSCQGIEYQEGMKILPPGKGAFSVAEYGKRLHVKQVFPGVGCNGNRAKGIRTSDNIEVGIHQVFRVVLPAF